MISFTLLAVNIVGHQQNQLTKIAIRQRLLIQNIIRLNHRIYPIMVYIIRLNHRIYPIMGCSGSKAAFSPESGTESEYKATFDEQKLLGQGEFGVVKLIIKKSDPAAEPLAVKILNKGFVFKDNTLYTPMKPEVLKVEIDILRKLGGQKYNLVLDSVYESNSKVYVVTEMCAG